ncbi:Beta-barrel assembly-enhancing protease [Usitatibacter rugosus]|uniref:Beta-barrel assembly-enhancing protease n=1 Tax=Usitatibacter rugosus TaxID=2732067 RepID=A0A6M4GSZ5_9PROT|nr:tetratricopeptide repeat protein [Usitatibacter rugosus]QJR10165.1 Beta-barrel assembly-enhancing protease [Usitatibacter rugosus]
MRWPGTGRGLAAALSVLVLSVTAGCDRSAVASTAPAAKPAAAKPSYASELANLDAAIADGVALAAKRPDDTLVPLEVVTLYLERARLTGNYEDYRRAELLLDAQPGARVPTASFCLARARLHFTLHRLKQTAAALDTCPAGTSAPDMAALRADIAMYSGRYRDAEETYRALVNQLGGSQHFTRLALLRKSLGAPGEAAALLEAAESRYYGVSATQKAWYKLQRGLVALERGRYDEALALYRRAEEALPGWWLVEEHIAEVTHFRGDNNAAATLYRSIVERTRAPEFMDALAAIEHAQGQEEKARELSAQARALYERRLSEFPEAAAGHALDHFLVHPVDAPRAITLAESNFRVRPYGESAVGLAKAWILSGQPKRAVPILATQVANGWDTAEARWVLAEAMDRSGQRSDAERERARALSKNPESARMYALPQ